MVSCQKGPTRHAYASLIGPFWRDAFDLYNLDIITTQLLSRRCDINWSRHNSTPGYNGCTHRIEYGNWISRTQPSEIHNVKGTHRKNTLRWMVGSSSFITWSTTRKLFKTFWIGLSLSLPLSLCISLCLSLSLSMSISMSIFMSISISSFISSTSTSSTCTSTCDICHTCRCTQEGYISMRGLAQCGWVPGRKNIVGTR